ncbi:TPA: hypothetical protein PXN14_000087 [Yersinia enterocolitica]|uniref:Tail fiber protein n=1 Tax=Yersinia enterocolitica W22703 TaxID=913028 RepID=F4N2J7_YEREN|nr:phage tail fiber protein [Yersinia enterocolitica]QCW23306.1 hypothetical protein [Yersinia phage YeP4]QCW23532.1 hypothetical protein [Yersinia phage YeP5]QCW23570.1 hypothetical protein [Yersinia phage YeP6]CBX72305.1 hypothetical protein YEW_AK02420 [Yersinia enterocolitica W22703]ADZ41858.1 Tail fiber [Yersinia enterocolitica subsp. palearctica 105.5R(r)]
MAVPNQTPYTVYTANGVTTVFPFNFMVFSATDLAVSINGTVLSSGFTVSGVGIVNGGAVTFLTPPASGVTVMLARVMPLVRVTEYQDNGDLLAATVNKDFDRIWMVLQGQAVDHSLALSRPSIAYDYYAGRGYRITNIAAPINDQDATTKSYVDALAHSNDQHTLRVPESVVGVIPSVALRSNKLLGFSDSGEPVAIDAASGSAADVLIKLAKPTGADLVGYSTGTVKSGLDNAISILNTNIQLPGNLGVKGLEVHPMGSNPTEGGQIDLYDKADARAAFIDIDSGGNFRVVTESLGVTLSINRTTGNIVIPKALTAAGILKGYGIIAEGTVYAGNTAAWLAADGNVYGSVWGGYLSTYLSNRTEHRVRAWAAVQGNGTIISSFGFAAINRTNVGGYNFTMSTSNGAYAVTVGINGGSQNGALNAHSANIWNRTPNSFSIQNANDSGTQYNWIDWPEFYVIVVGP